MKRFLLLLLLLAAGYGPSLAQTSSPTPEFGVPLTAFADSINRIFQAVDRTRVASGILRRTRVAIH